MSQPKLDIWLWNQGFRWSEPGLLTNKEGKAFIRLSLGPPCHWVHLTHVTLVPILIELGSFNTLTHRHSVNLHSFTPVSTVTV